MGKLHDVRNFSWISKIRTGTTLGEKQIDGDHKDEQSAKREISTGVIFDVDTRWQAHG